MKPRLLVVVPVLAASSAALLAGTGTGADDTPAKVFVCKYVGTPGIDERLQTGDNPISVSTNAIPLGDVRVGSEFADAQGRSLVVAFDTGQPEPDCPTPHGGTTTTGVTSSTTTTTCPDCVPNTQGATTTTTTTTTTSTSTAPTTTTSSTPSTTTSTTSTSQPPPSRSSTTSSSTTTLPATLDIGSASTVCRRDAPFVALTFGNQPAFNGHVGTITFLDLNGNVIETHAVTYQANTTIELVYPGAVVAADGTALDWPGWMLNSDGYWVLDPSDAIYRDGITIVAEINPTATTTITYPPETAACASPDGPFPPAPQQLPATR